MNKHLELFKKIPCGNFGTSKLFFDKFKTKQPKDITLDDIVLAYYYISEEMMDDIDSNWFIVRRNNPPLHKYDCHDPVTKEHIFVSSEFKDAKLYNGVIQRYSNRTPKRKQYGLVAIPKNNQDISSDFEDFRIFADNYKRQHFRLDTFTNERRYCLGTKELEHLYTILKTLFEKANFHYKQPGSIILAQELANVMANYNIVKDNQYTPNGRELVHQHKLFMFGELQR